MWASRGKMSLHEWIEQNLSKGMRNIAGWGVEVITIANARTKCATSFWGTVLDGYHALICYRSNKTNVHIYQRPLPSDD